MFKEDLALAYHPQTPKWQKVGIPGALGFCIIMFMTSHTNVLASVDIRMEFGGEMIDLRGERASERKWLQPPTSTTKLTLFHPIRSAQGSRG